MYPSVIGLKLISSNMEQYSAQFSLKDLISVGSLPAQESIAFRYFGLRLNKSGLYIAHSTSLPKA